MSYFSLHNHSDFSNSRLLDSINKIGTLIDYAHDIGLLGVAITDHEDLGGHVRALDHLNKRREENLDDESWQNFKVILGNEIYLCRNGLTKENFIKGEDFYYHFLLLALDEIGHEQLRELSTRAFKQSYFSNMRRVPTYYNDIEEVIGKNPGHIWLSSACLGGYLPHMILQNKPAEFYKFIEWANQVSNNNFSIELQPLQDQDQIKVNQTFMKVIDEKKVLNPFIITTDSHYLKKEDKSIHHAFLNSKGGDRETESFYSAAYMMNSEEIHSYLDHVIGENKVNVGLNNTIDIGTRAQEYNLRKKTHLPYMPLKLISSKNNPPKNMPYLQEFFTSTEEADKQLAYKIINYIEETPDANLERIEEELKSIAITDKTMEQKWSKYLLQVADYVNICWDKGDTLVGPARGSGAGFSLNYILNITQVDPTREKASMKHWRFLNPERASLVDIDIDIQGNRRNKCIQALKNQYGEFRVIEVATFGTEKAKSAIRTACRGLGIDVDTATYLSSFISSERGIQHTLTQTFYGDKENGINPNYQFKKIMTEEFPEVWEVAQKIEGLISRVGKHAGGVVIVDEDFTKRAAIRTTNKDEFVSQYELNDLESLGLIKIDLLAIESLDRIRACLDLLIQHNYIEEQSSLKETYENTIGVYNLDRTSSDMWKMVWNNEIISLFQMEQNSGIQAISLTKPHSLEDLAVINSIMRLMAPERGAEQPLNKYARFKANPQLWEDEMISYGLTIKERQLLHGYLDYEYGLCATQEDIMSMVQDPLIGGFGLAWADKLRKSIAKKHPEEFDQLTQEFFENAKEKKLSQKLVEYVWNVLFKTQKGYSFGLAHTLSYSIIGLQQMNLAYHFPILFWNTANIIVDSMATDFIGEDEEEIGYNEEEENTSSSTVEYGKIAKAIGKMKDHNIIIHPPDINKSKLTFSPDIETNSIYYGLKGINKINDKIAEEILLSRPYLSFDDFISKVKLNKPQIISLIKSGAFDSYEKRQELMKRYIFSISDTKKKLTLQNVPMLIKFNLLPAEVDKERQIFNFTRHIRKHKFEDFYHLDEAAYDFYQKSYDIDQIDFTYISDTIKGSIQQSYWDRIYKKEMNTLRTYLKENEKELLDKLNTILVSDVIEKYALGSISKWEMDSLSFYSHEHELQHLQNDYYNIVDFFSLDEEPEVNSSFMSKDNYRVNLYKLYRIAGTVIDKDKMKHTITLLTTTGVVTIKMWGNSFSKYDKQVSELLPTGKKKVVEKSWFTRGNKLIFTGIRRGNNFIPKIYKNSSWQFVVEKIEEINNEGYVKTRGVRVEV